MNVSTGAIDSTIVAGAYTRILSSVAVDPSGGYAYAVGASTIVALGSRVLKIDLSSNTIVGSLAVAGQGARDIAIDQTGTHAYVVVNGQPAATDKLVKINLAGFSVAATIDLPGWYYYAVALNPASPAAYVSNYENGSVAKVNTSTGALEGSFQADTNSGDGGDGAWGIAVNPTGTYAFVVTEPGTMSKVDLSSDTVVAAFQAGGNARNVAISPSGAFVYTDSPYGNFGRTVAKINAGSTRVVAWIPTGFTYGNAPHPRGLAIDATGSFLYAILYSTNTLAKVNLAPTPTASISSSTASPQVASPVAFDASGSVALWGEDISYAWDLDGNGSYETSTGNEPTTQRSFSTIGRATVGVRITAVTGMATASVAVDVVPDSVSAKIKASADPVMTGQSVTFDAGDSTAASGVVSKYEWDLDGSGTYEVGGRTVTKTFNSVGLFPVAVRVASRGGVVETVSTTVDVRPTPPAGELGVSVNNGDIATNNPDVVLKVVWPTLAATALISNDGGFGKARSIPLAEQIPWKLQSSGLERLPKIVYLRFRGGESGRETYTDDIILDERPPSVVSASLAGATRVGVAKDAAARKKTVTVKATDNNTGVARIEIAKKKGGKPFLTRQLVAPNTMGKRKTMTKLKVAKSTKKAYVRVTDVAGNVSAWKALRAK